MCDCDIVLLLLHDTNKKITVLLEVQCRFSEANPVIAHVELGVVRSNEDIAQDPDGAHGRRNVQAHEAGQTDRLAELGDLHDVVVRLEGEVHSSNVEVDVREVWKSSTI